MPGQKKSENIAYLVAWAVLFAAPLLSEYVMSAATSGSGPDWEGTLFTWRILVFFCVAFCVHNFLIAPLLVYRGRKMAYACATAALVACLCAYQWCWKPDRMPRPERNTPPPGMLVDKSGTDGRRGGRPPRPPRERPHGEGDGKDGPRRIWNEKQFMTLLIILLMLGMNVGTKNFFKSLDDRKRMKEMERQNLIQQLEYLKYQINPHFFMNTLNNIHALVDIDPEEAKYTIEVLSKLMRYVLYDSNRPMAPLRKELDFIRHYVDLMRIRYTDHVRITVQLPDDVPEVEVPPLLFITFIENAFKHGVSYDRPSFIEVRVSVAGDRVLLLCRNSVQPQTDASGDKQSDSRRQGGVGLENARKRLRLIYKDGYKLNVKEENGTYTVTLQLINSVRS